MNSVPIFIEQEKEPQTSIIFWIPENTYPITEGLIPQICHINGTCNGSAELSEIETQLDDAVNEHELKGEVTKNNWYSCDIKRVIEDQFTTSYHFINLKDVD